MVQMIEREGLEIDASLYDFVEKKLCTGIALTPQQFWQTLHNLVTDFSPRNQALLQKRDRLQAQLDQWHKENGPGWEQLAHYQGFLREIGYLVPQGEDFTIETDGVDDEIALVSGPQLVVPVKNARFAINAANARWGSLYDAFYGTDVIEQSGALAPGKIYNEKRGAAVIAKAKSFLDTTFPLTAGNHKSAIGYKIDKGKLNIIFEDAVTDLQNPDQLVGFSGHTENPSHIVLKNNGLHVVLFMDRSHPIGRTDKAGLADILLESALTVILDCEDSVAAVDGEDKTEIYTNLLGLFQRNLSCAMEKNGKKFLRRLEDNHHYKTVNGNTLTLSGLSLLLVRNVGHLMTTPAVKKDGTEIYETILDALVSGVLALHDQAKKDPDLKNSQSGAVYIVKPKMHGPEEVAFANDLFAAIEAALGLPATTLKMGIMDEERRTSVNLKECIRAAKSRVIFINTGFLDRTGDEIHSAMEAGPMVRKDEMKNSTWLDAYERNNVDMGLACGFQGRAQIGKGMWAMPDEMAAMLAQKQAHPQAGADTAWAPSPTAATLHALHYHAVNVDQVQEKLRQRPPALLEDLLTAPIAQKADWPQQEIIAELENNAQGILGYVVRWIDQGIGCSKVPDRNNIGLMEDRATLRISSQHIANWLYHGICTRDQVMEVMKRMAVLVDRQNSDDPVYQPMAKDFDTSIAFQAACDLVFDGRTQPNGYTEPILHRRRLQKKADKN